SLVKSGAFDSLGGSRAGHWASIDDSMKHGQRLNRERASGQNAFFGAMAASAPAPARQPVAVEEWTEEDRLAGEYAVLGFYISGHPLDKFAGRLAELKAIDIGMLESQKNGADIIVAGIVVQTRPMRSKRDNQRWAIVTLQDRTAVVECLVFSEPFSRLETVLKSGVPLLVKGRVAVEDAGTRLRIMEAKPLEQMLNRTSSPSLLRVRVDLSAADDSLLDRLDQVMASRPGRCRVEFDLLSGDGTEATLESDRLVRADAELLDQIRGICGADSVVM
ncbi:MAG: OB-fold nucleic acid binding domain-containing protein, partial [Candidatus Acidiferrales bacterium]